MDKLFRVQGKIFYTEEEALEYEAQLKKAKEEEEARKAKAEAERKAREEKQKHLAQFKQKRLDEVSAKAKEFNELVKAYQEDYKTSLYITYELNGGVKVMETSYLGDLLSDTLKKCYFYK